MLLAEHGLDAEGVYTSKDPQQLDRITTYFEEIDAQAGRPARYVPRSVQIDLEGGVIGKLKSGPRGSLFPPDSWVHADSGAANNWGKGHYTEGAELVEKLMDLIRKQSEKCDALQGFQLIHSLGGGTGSGLGTLLLSKLREEEPDRMLATFSVMPSPLVSETVVEPYNAILSIHQLTENSDLTVCMDNEALHNINVKNLKIQHPEFSDLNKVIAQVMCGVSTSLRFPGQLNGDLRKLGMNLVPFPRLHYLLPSYAPLVSEATNAYQSLAVPELVASLFDRHNLLVACDPRMGRYLTAATIFRGNISSQEVEIAVQQLQTKNSQSFVDWIPDNVSITLCAVPPVGRKQAGVSLSNTTAIQELFRRVSNLYSAMFKRKAFLHWYTQEGMDEMEFQEAESNVMDLIAEYQQYEEGGGFADESYAPSSVGQYEDETPSEY
ncbi:Tubulin beta-2 chain [Serendipita sp. 396]|nr:Tubulin beta-2 chain [Serendipita sp. 396]KAG8788282.1 Tubulin beta-2 chain [Serendipita sp. 397]KAG8803518.1 Tubulin beta-2 chain [Serendipita sp. 398]KAG8825822.1 Tubulin beta-2 chain [Serendipita sp. 401]KAG8836137.1 Tubulin beta-2 chain [Serendipita sp. 400]KAG8874569.1 Tubulin beta-2 chain [Serendipita sp. 405]KAG9056597.1 Tubulin beta-2 chain [Serendipita sp. 407]